MRTIVLLLAGALLAGCASVSPAKRDQVERAQQIGPYSYQRAPGPMP